MRTFRLRSVRIAVALIVGAAGGAQIVAIQPAVAQVPAFGISPTQELFEIKAGETVLLGKIFNIQPLVPLPQISVIWVYAGRGLEINGLPGNIQRFPFWNLGELRAARVTATEDSLLWIDIEARNSPTDSRVSLSRGQTARVQFIAPAPPAPAPPAPAPPAPAPPAPAPPAPAPPAPAPPAPAPGPAPAPPAPAPPAPGPSPAPLPAGGVPVVGGGNRVPVVQSMALIGVAGAVSPLVLQGSDPDANALTFVVVQFPVHGKLSGQAPNLSYTPDRGFVGTDALIFTASDGTASSAQATVTITVTGKAVSIARTVSRAVRRTVKKTTKKR